MTEYFIRFAFCQAAAAPANWQHCQRQSKASKCKQRIRSRIRTHDSARGDKWREGGSERVREGKLAREDLTQASINNECNSICKLATTIFYFFPAAVFHINLQCRPSRAQRLLRLNVVHTHTRAHVCSGCVCVLVVMPCHEYMLPGSNPIANI